VSDACAGSRGDPTSIRYARNGIARLELAPGSHRVVIGSRDRVAERSVELVNYQTQPLAVDLADAAHLLFRGCPPAVERYMQGDWEGAARALERDGQTRTAHLLRGQRFEELGDRERAAQHGAAANRLRDEADLPGSAGFLESTASSASAGEVKATEPLSPVAAHSGSRYDILEQIGRGGMGVVFKARDKRLGRLVALKQLPENLRDHPTAVALFHREARAAAALNHPNIVTLYDADEEDGKFFLTMELLEGAPLHRILRSEGPIAPSRCARVGVQVAAGLQYAHKRGIVHRDIKTANLFWTRERVVKIMDFGLAKTMEEVRRSTTVLGGTPYYMAPEQAAGESVDPRADLYALGVTLFEMLTGAVPFAEGDVPYHHRHTPPPDPRSLLPGLPDAFAELILALLAKRPEDRMASAEEVGARLSQL
jgi:tRNA A-37 threonylcarbamoyl transferase component Bud32